MDTGLYCKVFLKLQNAESAARLVWTRRLCQNSLILRIRGFFFSVNRLPVPNQRFLTFSSLFLLAQSIRLLSYSLSLPPVPNDQPEIPSRNILRLVDTPIANSSTLGLSVESEANGTLGSASQPLLAFTSTEPRSIHWVAVRGFLDRTVSRTIKGLLHHRENASPKRRNNVEVGEGEVTAMEGASRAPHADPLPHYPGHHRPADFVVARD
jgi:hypothetical protein